MTDSRRRRSTKAEVEARCDALLEVTQGGRPITVRQVFDRACVRGLVEKAETRYSKAQTDLTVTRQAGNLPYHYLADTGSTLDSLGEINRRWPDLSFKDFWGAGVLAAAVEWEREGRA
jgi:hypothetical protein